ncbi:heavy metal translocating P-type ATPase [Lutimonas halocynthiae]|uniref:heavy metal translocating P-type ATPase n=1 Tax=Lutimonas halocynthiae TaxID=1446477 RepID=UPI0025B56BA2|nr:heavy metal translocating P-type ATPase [Lutimonas halocynthiae]MDN3643928.1 heavy metal translocating P-type ATPase [Lutimonas halocynthiae]
MKESYQIQGMSCNGCKNHVEKILSAVEDVQFVKVDLDKKSAQIESISPISIDKFKMALRNDGAAYTIHPFGESLNKTSQKPEIKKGSTTGKFYCPMHCEGEKIYDAAGDCPVCGMDLVEEIQLNPTSALSYICSMHPEIIEDQPGACPICGMDLILIEPDASAEEKNYLELLRKLWISVAFTLPIFLIAMSEMIPDNPLFKLLDQKYWNWLQLLLSLPVVFYTTWMFFQRAYRSIMTWNLNMFTLIGIGAGIAWLFSVFAMLFPDFFPEQFKTENGTVHVYFEAATVILTLVLLGQVLEARAHSKTNSAVKELLKLAPNTAYLFKNGVEKVIGTDQIQLQDVLRVKPGDKIPVDGIIIEGSSIIDESMVTGEPLSVSKSIGDVVNSGTINGNQTFLMRAEKIGADTLLSQIIQMVNEASRSRAPIQNLADKVSAYFVPIVVAISVITFAVWAIWGPDPVYVYALVNSIAVLIIACPCALGLATPMSVMVGVGRSAQSGVLIKNAEALEKIDKIDTLIIDKTGTITKGKSSVEKIAVFDNGYEEGEILLYMASLNQMSEHPLAEAIVNYAKKKDIKLLEADQFKSITGMGVQALINGKEIILGNDKMMASVGAGLSEKQHDKAAHFQKQGKTVSFISISGSVRGFAVISDPIKDTSAKAIKELQDQGIAVIMLTGDNENTAKYVAESLQLTSYRASCLPEDKLKEIEKLQSQGHVVAMAGDGINDAPALAISDVGIAMGTGTDVAIESATITLVKGDLQGIVKAKNLGHQVMKNIKQNLFFALVYNTIGVPVAAGVLYPIFGILLSPMIAALAMSFSSVSVIANALRLKNIKI